MAAPIATHLTMFKDSMLLPVSCLLCPEPRSYGRETAYQHSLPSSDAVIPASRSAFVPGWRCAPPGRGQFVEFCIRSGSYPNARPPDEAVMKGRYMLVVAVILFLAFSAASFQAPCQPSCRRTGPRPALNCRSSTE